MVMEWMGAWEMVAGPTQKGSTMISTKIEA